MDDFDVDTRTITLPTKKITASSNYNICCDQEMKSYFDRDECEVCGQEIMHIVKEDISYTNQHNNGPSTDKLSVRVSKSNNVKSYTIYPSYELAKEAKIIQEFNTIRTNYPWIEDNIIIEAKHIYKKIVAENNITKKKNKKMSIQKACIFVIYENIGNPKSKIEFSRSIGITETNLTKGYNFLYENNNKFNLGLIKYGSLDLILHFINRLKPKNLAKNIEMFLINMNDIVKNNHYLHQNKHPECLAAGILLYTAEVYNIVIIPDEIASKICVSIKNIKCYASFLTKIRKDPTNKCYKYFNLIIKEFVTPLNVSG